jgi:uncharacterized protein (DUF885 family)
MSERTRRRGPSPAVSSLAALALAACASGGAPRSEAASQPAPTQDAPREDAPREAPPEVGAGAAGSVRDPELAGLLERHWAWTLETDPLFATALGVHAFDDRLPDRTRAGRERRRARKAAFLEEARALDPDRLAPPDAVTLALLVEELESDLASGPCRFEAWSLSPRSNPVTEWGYLPELHTVTSPADLERLLARYRAIPGVIDADIAALRSGAEEGLYANAESTRRVLAMVEEQLETPVSEWPLAAPAKAAHPGWPAETRARLQAELLEVVKRDIRPALVRYRDLVKDELLPNARPQDRTGLSALPFGEACYAARIRRFTTLSLDAETLHETGLREVERIDEEMARLGEKLFGLDDRLEILAKLRSDPALHFDTAEAVEAKAEAALAKAKAAIPAWFGLLPKADCVVRRIPAYEAPYTTIAYYRQPAPDGSKPGEYFINVHAPTTRPRYEAEALAFHESIPGHHLQIAIAQELGDLPEFRKHLGMTVFVEGWALYTEQLADEMGLYSGDLDRMGMLSYEAWRAARLVVDTGLHAFGWSREKAKAFMKAHTALAANNIDNEVDRYIAWPGQALAYKTGQLEIWRLRRAAEAELGERFDIRGFHDAVLGGGAVTLSVLKDQVEAWVASRRPSEGPTRAAP